MSCIDNVKGHINTTMIHFEKKNVMGSTDSVRGHNVVTVVILLLRKLTLS